MNVFEKNINRSVFVNVICVVLTAATLLSFVLPSAVSAADSVSSLVSSSDMTRYTVTDKDGKEVSSIEKGDTVNIEIHLKNRTLKYDDLTKEGKAISAYKVYDSFSDAEVTAAVVDSDPLETILTVSDIVYSGVGSTLHIKFTYTDANGKQINDEITLTVSECVEYVEPDGTYPDPTVMITRDSLDELKPGDEFTLTLNFENKSKYYTLEDPTVSVELNAGLIPLEQTLTQSVSDITSGRTRSASVRLKVAPEADSPTLSVNVTIKYHYTTEDAKRHEGTASETIYIPLTVAQTGKHVPELRIERDDKLPAIKAGEDFTLRLYIWNVNAYAAATSPVVKLNVPEGFILIDTTESRYIPDIYPQSPVVVDVKLRAPDEITKSQCTIGVNVEYGYDGAAARETASENVLIPTVPTTSAADTNRPALEITRGDMSAVNAGEEFTLRLYIKNTSADKAAISPTVKLTVPDGLILLDSTESKHIPDIAANSQAVVDVKLRAAEDISSQSQTVGVAVSYSYKEGSETKEGDASENVIVPTVPSSSGTSDNKKPVLRITRGELGTVKADQSFTLTVTVENLGDVTIDDVVAKVTINGDLLIMDSTATHYLSPLAPGKSETFKVKMKASSTISSESQSVTVHVDYTYPSSTGAAESTDETLFVQTKKTEPADTTMPPADEQGATPKVLISKYGFGDEAQVAAGSTFDLNMTFCNTSADYEVENVMITLSPSTGLSISSSSNTIYYASMGVGEELSETVGIQALPTAETGSISINVTIEYQYKVAGAYQSTSIQQSIAIPIYQPDRFEVELSGVPEFATAYQEMYISMPYINKGKSTISNVRAEVVSEDGAVSALQTVQNLGNFESGRNGTIDFIVTPNMSGEVTFTIRITYEDPNAQEKTLDYPITLNVEEPYYPPYDDPGYIDDPTIDPGTEENNGLPWWAWALIGVGIIIVLTIVIVKVTKRRKLKKSHRREFSWDDVDDDAEDNGNSGVGDTYVGGNRDGKK